MQKIDSIGVTQIFHPTIHRLDPITIRLVALTRGRFAIDVA